MKYRQNNSFSINFCFFFGYFIRFCVMTVRTKKKKIIAYDFALTSALIANCLYQIDRQTCSDIPGL